MSSQVCRVNGSTMDAEKDGVCSIKANLGDFTEELKTDGTHFETLMEYSTVVANRLPQRQAFYTIDLADILWKIQEWKRCLPNVEFFYAVKANADPVLLKLLVLLGLSFDCATEGEIEQMLKTGASPDDIIFTHTIKTENGLQFARDKGVHLMTFDNEEEVRKIHRLHPTARLLLRLAPTKVECSFDFSSKFGCSEEEYVELLLLAKQLGLNVVGIAFHVGSLCTDPSSFTSTLQTCRHVFDKARDMGFMFSILDIGGGFFGQIGTEELFYKMFYHIQEALDEHFPSGEVRVIAEPGCYLVASASRLVCTIIGKRILKNTRDDQPSRHYFTNDGIFGSFFVNIDYYGLLLKPMLFESEERARRKYNSDIFGQTCHTYDVIRRNTPLVDMRVGERIVWENMGAYASSSCSTFNGTFIPQTRHVFVKNERLKVGWINKAAKNFIEQNVVFIGSKDTEAFKLVDTV